MTQSALVLATISTPMIGLAVANVLLIWKREVFSTSGKFVAFVLGIICTSFRVAMAPALPFVILNLQVLAVGIPGGGDDSWTGIEIGNPST